MFRNIKYLCIRIFTMFYGIYHKTEKRVIFESFHGEQYSDNPRAVSEKLHEVYPEFEIVWALNSINEGIESILPNYVRVINRRSLDYYRILATSFAYVTNEGLVKNIYKKREQFFVQTWHGDRGYKKILYECTAGAKPIDFQLTDLCVAGSEFGVKLFKSAFLFKGKILNVGCPRNDCLIIDNNKNDEIKKSISVFQKKILLYAPTFRSSNVDFNDYKINISEVLNILEGKGEHWVCLIRLHPTHNELMIGDNDRRVIDVTKYPDMADLLQISDMLITDYSSCAFDFVIKRKPFIIAAFDKEQYVKESRDLRMNIEDPGSIIAYNQQELSEKIRKLTNQDYIESCNNVINFFNINETGNAAKTVCDEINLHYLKAHIGG